MAPTEVDLMTLLPDKFTEIPYLTQINEKKRTLEEFRIELSKLLKPGVTIKQKEYATIFNVLNHMLEDKTMLVYIEAIKTVEILAQLLKFQLKPKIRTFIQLLASKYGEMKTAVITTVDKAMSIIVTNCLTP